MGDNYSDGLMDICHNACQPHPLPKTTLVIDVTMLFGLPHCFRLMDIGCICILKIND